MVESEAKLAWDLAILQEMAAEMGDYLKSETLFWPMGHSEMPKLSLGGYWLRQQRLTTLHKLLTGEQQAQLSAAMKQFETAVSGWVVRAEQRAHNELEVRTRQWNEYLGDIRAGKMIDIAGYAARVEARAIMAALVSQLQQAPYVLDESLLAPMIQQDKALRSRWAKSDFIWPTEWQSAYPQPEFWWLYGRPK